MGRVNIAYQLAETVDKLTPDRQPHPQIFTILANGLAQISELGASWQQTVENWLLQIITELGFWSQDQEFTGDIYEFIESVSERSLNSPKLLAKLRK
jgi:recombinational DNA repair protein (RecF pathway)